MKKNQLFTIALLLFVGLNGTVHAQCNMPIPSNVIVVDAPTGASGSDKHFWICDTLSCSGMDHFFYIENGGYVTGSGIGPNAYVKAGGEYDLNGVDDTVYYETGAILSNTPAVAILCSAVIFDYTNAPSSNCVITQLPQAGFVASDDTICEGGCVNFTDTSITIGTTSWSWTFPGGTPTASTNQNPTICYSTAGSYTAQLIVTDSIGVDTATFVITVIVCTGLGSEPGPANFSMFPNPASEQLQVISLLHAGTIRFNDVTGRLIMSRRVGAGNSLIDISSLPAGLYIVELVCEDHSVAARRLVVE